jgi:hypothetical protein
MAQRLERSQDVVGGLAAAAIGAGFFAFGRKPERGASFRMGPGYSPNILSLPVPLLLGFVLGPMLEENLRRAMIISRGDATVFVIHPLSLALLMVSLALLVVVLLATIRAKREEAFQERARQVPDRTRCHPPSNFAL